MIRDKLVPVTHYDSSNRTETAKSYRLLVDTSTLNELEKRGIQLNTVSVQILGLSGRASTRLRIANISTIQQLISCSENTLLNIPHVGVAIVEEIKSKLTSYLIKELDRNTKKSFVTEGDPDKGRLAHSPLTNKLTSSLHRAMSRVFKPHK